MKRTPLKRKPVNKKGYAYNSTIRRISAKQEIRQRRLSKIPRPKDGRCERCGALPYWMGLEKHHIKLRSLGGGDERDNLVWLCRRCHNEMHGIKEMP